MTRGWRRFQLNRVKLPSYHGDGAYRQGKTDFPMDMLLKVANPKLLKKARAVALFYERFALDNTQQSEMLGSFRLAGLSPMRSVCNWLAKQDSRLPGVRDDGPGWRETWIVNEFTCDVGRFVVGKDTQTPTCEDCRPGYYSASVDPSTACDACNPGFFAPAKAAQCRSCEWPAHRARLCLLGSGPACANSPRSHRGE